MKIKIKTYYVVNDTILQVIKIEYTILFDDLMITAISRKGFTVSYIPLNNIQFFNPEI